MSWDSPKVWIIGGSGALGATIGALARAAWPEAPSPLLIGRSPAPPSNGRAHLHFHVKGANQSLIPAEPFTFPYWMIGDPQLRSIPSPDLVILSVKSHQLDLVIENLRPLSPYLTPSTGFLVVGNGLGIWNKWTQAFPQWSTRTSRATCWFGARWISPGELGVAGLAPVELAGSAARPWVETTWQPIRALHPTHYHWLGERPEDAEVAEWRKTIWNGSMNPVFGLAGVTNGEGARNPELMHQVQELVAEMLRVANAHGINSLGSAQEWTEKIRNAALQTGANLNSMGVDLKLNRQTEIDALNGEVIRKGAALGVPTPHCERVLKQIFERSQKTLLHS